MMKQKTWIRPSNIHNGNMNLIRRELDFYIRDRGITYDKRWTIQKNQRNNTYRGSHLKIIWVIRQPLTKRKKGEKIANNKKIYTKRHIIWKRKTNGNKSKQEGKHSLTLVKTAKMNNIVLTKTEELPQYHLLKE